MEQDKVKCFLDTDQKIFLIVGYEQFTDENDDAIIVQVRTVELMGETDIDPDNLPTGWLRSIQQNIESQIAIRLYGPPISIEV